MLTRPSLMIFISRDPISCLLTNYHGPWVNTCLAKCLDNVLKVTAVVVTFNQEKVLVGAFFMIIQL